MSIQRMVEGACHGHRSCGGPPPPPAEEAGGPPPRAGADLGFLRVMRLEDEHAILDAP